MSDRPKTKVFSNISSFSAWANLGKELRLANQKTAPDWWSVQKLIDAAQPILQENMDKARRLLERSNQLFAPLKDPFEIPLGLHRWLSVEREEAYSDWLAWIIEQLSSPETIVGFLCGETPADLVSQCVGQLKVYRETVFSTAQSVRRTDIEICFGAKRTILIEVKMVDTDEVSDQQLSDQRSYATDFEKRLLLVPSGNLSEGRKFFTLVLWKDICLRLRKLIPSLSRENITIAAMVSAFVGAVEQNVLRLPPKSEWYFVTSAILDHLSTSLEGSGDD
jgi:hypothetical protein